MYHNRMITDHSDFIRIYAHIIQIPLYMFISMLFTNERTHSHIEAVASQ